MSPNLNHLMWIEEFISSEVELVNGPLGVSYYLDQKLILILTEKSKTTEYKGKSFPFQLWFGVFFPVEKMKQSAVIAKFPFLENHPGQKNSLYLPAETEDFETLVRSVMREINKKNPLFGIQIKEKKSSPSPRLMKNQGLKKTAPNLKTNKKSENALMMEILKRRSR